MKSLAFWCLYLGGVFSTLAALGCAFVTFATSDYRPIIASGIGFSVLALSCHGALIWWGRQDTPLEVWCGVLLSLIALAELLLRAANGLLSRFPIPL
jgi:hypothetical protein